MLSLTVRRFDQLENNKNESENNAVSKAEYMS